MIKLKRLGDEHLSKNKEGILLHSDLMFNATDEFKESLSIMYNKIKSMTEIECGEFFAKMEQLDRERKIDDILE